MVNTKRKTAIDTLHDKLLFFTRSLGNTSEHLPLDAFIKSKPSAERCYLLGSKQKIVLHLRSEAFQVRALCDVKCKYGEANHVRMHSVLICWQHEIKTMCHNIRAEGELWEDQEDHNEGKILVWLTKRLLIWFQPSLISKSALWRGRGRRSLPVKSAATSNSKTRQQKQESKC